jgi:hypothetical protein
MAKRKAPELSPEAVAANAVGEARREKEKAARQANAEKQKRFREGMKAEGFKQVLLWALPCPADVRERMAAGFRQVPAWEASPALGKKRKPLPSGVVKVAVPVRESSLGAADNSPDVRRALYSAMAAFLDGLGESPEKETLYKDFAELIKPLGDPLGSV